MWKRDRKLVRQVVARGCQLEAAIQRVRDLHTPIQTNGVLGSVTHCLHCTRLIGNNSKIYMAFWPCTTLRALNSEQE